MGAGELKRQAELARGFCFGGGGAQGLNGPEARLDGCAQGDVLADGSDAKDVALWEARRAAEAELRAAEEAVAAGEKV